jgi:hypothetical protein
MGISMICFRVSFTCHPDQEDETKSREQRMFGGILRSKPVCSFIRGTYRGSKGTMVHELEKKETCLIRERDMVLFVSKSTRQAEIGFTVQDASRRKCFLASCPN